jgi:hypothetical protein
VAAILCVSFLLLRRRSETMGKLTAWAQLRSSGRDGSATLDDLTAFVGTATWRRPLVDYGRAYSLKVEGDYKEFLTTKPK